MQSNTNKTERKSQSTYLTALEAARETTITLLNAGAARTERQGGAMKLTKREKEDVLDAVLYQANRLDTIAGAYDEKDGEELRASASALRSAYDKLNTAWTKEVVVTTKTKKLVMR